MFPKLYLAIDNCFASKRWTRPKEWAAIIRDSGLHYVECSADTECDMLYSDPGYLNDWRKDAANECEKNGIGIATVYTGHGTYSTLGLTHLDGRCRDRMREDWMFPHIDHAAGLKAIAGFYCHAFDNTMLQDPAFYEAYREILFDQMRKIATYGAEKGVIPSLEQMYCPHQYPWRISDAEQILSEVSRTAPLYITIDTGHQSGQRRYLRPDRSAILEAITGGKAIYVGPDRSQEILQAALEGAVPAEEAAERILEINRNYGYLFAEYRDGETWEWIRRLGAYSPILHLQQTDGLSSSHRDFSPASNAAGLIMGEKVIGALYDSFTAPVLSAMPPRVDAICLTLELFYANTALNRAVTDSIGISAAYWRRFIPYDGIPLDEAWERISEAGKTAN